VSDPSSRSFAILLTNRVHPTRNTPSTNGARRAAAEALAQAMSVQAPGGGRSWFSGQGGGSTSTLTTGTLHGSVRLSFEAFVNTEPTDLLTLESSTDGGATWTAVPMTVRGQTRTSLSGQSTRAWQQVRAQVAGGVNGVVLRWRYTTDLSYEGRGVNVADIALSCGHTTFTPLGWSLT
jgi:hypothetical protein